MKDKGHTHHQVPRNALVTGAAGFVGQYLTRHLVDGGRRVFGLDIADGTSGLKRCDLLDFEGLVRVIEECSPDEVYHLAGLTHPKDSLERPKEYYSVNVGGTLNLLEALRHLRLDARILIVSSAKVYGRVLSEVDLIDETQKPKPETPYASSKYLAEQLARQYYTNYGTQVVIARPFNHTGPGQPTGFVVPDFCKQVAEIQSLDPSEIEQASIHVGNLSPILDFLDVRDVVSGYSLLLEKGSPGEAYNVSSGIGVSIGELLDLILEVAQLPVSPAIVSRSPSSSAPPDKYLGDNSKIKPVAGWAPRYSLRETVEKTLEFWRKH